MTPLEFDILDELYFPATPAAVAEKLGLEYQNIIRTIQGMLEAGLIKPIEEEDLQNYEFSLVRFVATKKGLMAHNGLGRNE
jgi:DNA-binding MarR family transcriptional regulator